MPSQDLEQTRAEANSSNPKNSGGNDGTNPKTINRCVSSGLHRMRTLYLVRHGEAVHNVQERKAQDQARQESLALGLSEAEAQQRMEHARVNVLKDSTLRDAPLTERGRQQAEECAIRLQTILANESFGLPPPSEALVSPLSRTLETCNIILDHVKLEHNVDIQAHVRHEIQERQTQLPPDMARRQSRILRFCQSNDRFSMKEAPTSSISEQDIQEESMVRESKQMLRERASKLFDLLLEMEHLHLLLVSHKGYLRELERGLLGLTDSPLFDNAELRVYRVVFTRGDRALESVERVA